MYLDVADSGQLPYGWSRYAQFSLAVVNQIHNKYSIKKGILHCPSVFYYFRLSHFVPLSFMTRALDWIDHLFIRFSVLTLLEFNFIVYIS